MYLYRTLEISKSLSARVGKFLGAIAGVAGLLAVTSGAPAEGQTVPPKTFYVSASAPYNAANDGSSWTKAWTYTNQINWTSVQPGDTITFDGGTYGLTYKGTLTIGKSGLPNKPIKIVTSSEAGHAGQVTLTTTAAAPSYSGIDFGDHQYVNVEGRTNLVNGRGVKSLVIAGFYNYGVRVGPTAYNVRLKNAEIYGNGYAYAGSPANVCGLLVQGRAPTFENLSIHNNPTNVIIESSTGGYGPMFRKCWFGSEAVGAWGGYGQPIITWTEVDGIKVKDTYRGGFSWFHFYDCVFGPGLKTGIEFGQRNGGLSVNNSLFINPSVTNIKKVATTKPDSYYSIISLSRVTSFLTPLNRNGQGHSCLDFVTGQDSCYNSVYWGGTVSVVGTRTLGNFNFQNRTTGNTVVISPYQIDPGFQTDVGSIQPNDHQALFSTDFKLRAGAPAAGKGSTMTSVNQVLAP